jgi:hypothetical protein
LLNWPPISGSVTPCSGAVAFSRAARPPTGAIDAMRVSGWLFSSTLMLSAPNALRKRVPPADARNQVKSRMRMPFSAKGLPRFDGVSFCAGRASAAITGAFRAVGVSTVAASSFSSGARRPTVQPVAVPSHLLVA